MLVIYIVVNDFKVAVVTVVNVREPITKYAPPV
jgi:hypothetical protein